MNSTLRRAGNRRIRCWTRPVRARNIATGHARVGVQAGQIYGTIVVGSEPDQPTDLATGMATIRNLLTQAHRDGDLDEATYAAADNELNVADDCLKDNSPGSKATLVLALKRLRGLVADVAELATNLAAIIAMAKRLS